MNAIDIPAIRAAVSLSSVIGASVNLRRAGREYVGCCPFHQEKTPSFTVNDDKGFYHCFGCGAHGDALDWLRETEGLGLRDAAERLGGDPGSMSPARARPPLRDIQPERDTTAEAVAIWRAAAPTEGTPVDTYLREIRGIRSLPIPPTIRFASLRYGGRGDPLPCLVALVVGPDNKVSGIQRTYLAPNGRGKADVPKAKLSLGRVRGGAIRLAPAASELVVCEGLEDGLSLAVGLGRAVWVAAGASMLPSMELPGIVQSVVIGADGDAAGERSARAAAGAFSEMGKSVRIMRPDDGCKDFNEQLLRGTHQ